MQLLSEFWLYLMALAVILPCGWLLLNSINLIFLAVVMLLVGFYMSLSF